MSQSRRHSLIEALTQQTAGLVISLLLWEFVINPIWNLQTSVADNLTITMLFTVASIIRGYIFRRLFNRVGTPA
jgi:uncharacterized protein YacL